MASYYLLPDSPYLSLYSGVEARQPPKNVWLSVTFDGCYDWLGVEVNSNRCSCLANIDDNGKWTFSAHLNTGDIPKAHNGDEGHIDMVAIRLWRLAKESEVPSLT